MFRTPQPLALATALTLALPVAFPSIAQEKAAGGLEEVVVTARKREESLQDAPLTVTAYNAKRIAEYDITSLERIQQVTPQLYVGRVSNGSGAQITMRGIGASAATSIGIEQSVAVVMNGAYYGQGRVLNEGMFDLGQIEILKGPQSLFFGKNATAGVISLTTAKPTEEWEVNANLGYEFETEQTRVEGIVSGPLSDTVGIRVAIRESQMDGGWYKNNSSDNTYTYLDVATGFADSFTEAAPGDDRETPQEEETLARVTLTVDPSDALSMTFTGQYSDVYVLNSAYNHIPFSCDGGVSAWGVPCGDNFTIAHNKLPQTLADNLPYADGQDLYNAYESWSLNAEIEWEVGNFTLSSITNIQENENDWALPGDFADTNDGIFATEHAVWEAWSEELRIQSDFDGMFNFMLGGLYQETTREFFQWVTFGGGGALNWNSAAPAGLEHVTYNKESFTDGETLSLFGEVQLALTDRLEATAGVRYIDESKDSSFVQPYVHPIGIAALGWEAGGLTANQSFSEWQPEATISYDISDEVTIYGAYKTAYKSGGFSNGAVFAAVSQEKDFTFAPETASGFEVGVKSTLLDNQLRLNATLYSYEFEDLQLDYFDSAAIVFLTINAGQATSEGFEVDMEYAPFSIPGLTLRGTVAYNKAEYDQFIAPCFDGQSAAEGCSTDLPGYPGKPGYDISGQPTGMAPELSATGGFSYDAEMSNGWMWGIGGDVLYSDEYNASAMGHPYAMRDSYTLVNAMAYLGSGNWMLKLLGKNLSDEMVISGNLEGASSGAAAGRSQADLIGYGGPGRTIELQLRLSF
jgi:iron complex outermembrane receptor protein